MCSTWFQVHQRCGSSCSAWDIVETQSRTIQHQRARWSTLCPALGFRRLGGSLGRKPLLAPASGYGDISLWLVKPGLAAQESRVEPGLLDFHGFQNQWDVWVTVYYMNSADLRKPSLTPESYRLLRNTWNTEMGSAQVGDSGSGLVYFPQEAKTSLTHFSWTWNSKKYVL